MLSQSIWWGSVVLELLLLTRGFVGRVCTRYPIFYLYIVFVLSQSLLRFSVRNYSELYKYVYWTTEFLAVLIGCAVIFEVYRVGLSAYPGTARMARRFLTLMFLLVTAKVVIGAADDSGWLARTTVTAVEGALRNAQALAIVALVALFLFYAVPFGRNLRGILLGYGLFVGARVICVPLLPAKGHNFWFYAYFASYPVVLGVWLAHLWSYIPEPTPTSRIEQDYLRIAAATRLRLASARAHVAKAVRS